MHKVKLRPGQTLHLALVIDSSVEGEVTHVASDRSYIRLTNVRDVFTNRRSRFQYIYSSEIRSIQILKEAPDSGPSIPPPKPAITTKQLPNNVLDSALSKIDKCVYINQTDAGYHEAIEDLKNRRQCGVFMECIEDGRHIKSPSLLSFVTSDCIYIFDMKSLEMTTDVSNILCCDSYIRVIHNGRIMKDVLQHSYGLELGRCFDIKVALIAIDKADGKLDEDSAINSENTIQYCVEKFLKVPEKFFDEDVDFAERPLKNESKLAAAKHVAFLLDLQDHVAHEILLDKFYTSCEIYANCLAQTEDYVDSMIYIKTKEQRELQEISPFSLALDVELYKSQTN